MRDSARFVLFLALFSLLCACRDLAADVIYKNNGEELRGVIVEEYKDRIRFSTVNGEITVMKSDVKELYFDTEEDNLVKLADQMQERGDYIRAFAYYDMAFKKNPDSKKAKDGIVFLQGYLFRKEQAQKEEAVKRHELVERQGETSKIIESEEEQFNEKIKELRKITGMHIMMKGTAPKVESISMLSPAYEAGMRKGDLLVAVWGKLTGYLSLVEVIDMMLEKSSLEMKCTIERTVSVRIAAERNILSGPDELIGATFSMEFDGLTISGVKEPSPSFEAGLMKKDLIVALDGKSTRYMPLKQAVELIKNSKAGYVNLTLRREIMFWKKERI